MKQIQRKKKLGAESFDFFYGEIFGGRWEKLKQALLREGNHSSVQFENCAEYFLDPASIVSALCLPVRGKKSVLDLCAAPGGKTLVIAGNLDDDAILCANERSSSRKDRLLKVVSQSLPEEISSRIKITLGDGALLCKKSAEIFDCILLDAPCSSERHVLNDEKYLSVWSPSRIKTVSMEQWALLSSACRILKKGGFLLYSTCALCPEENDDSVEKIKSKFPEFSVADFAEVKNFFEENVSSFRGKISADENSSVRRIFSLAEKTKNGFHILPDSADGSGPIYFSLVKKS